MLWIVLSNTNCQIVVDQKLVELMFFLLLGLNFIESLLKLLDKLTILAWKEEFVSLNNFVLFINVHDNLFVLLVCLLFLWDGCVFYFILFLFCVA